MEKTMSMTTLTFQLGSHTLCKLLEVDHDGPNKDFFDNGQKT